MEIGFSVIGEALGVSIVTVATSGVHFNPLRLAFRLCSADHRKSELVLLGIRKEKGGVRVAKSVLVSQLLYSPISNSPFTVYFEKT